MPLVKRFVHCQIRINLKDHAPPHFHVLMRDGREVLIAISDLKILRGKVPGRELTEALQWAADNKEILLSRFKELQK